MNTGRLKFNGSVALAKEDDRPLHLQLRRIIADEIKSQHFPVGLKLPSERWFATKFEINRVTVRRAFEHLKEKGILKTHEQRSGVFVSPSARQKLKDPFPTIGIVLPEKFSTYITRNEWRLRYLDGIIDQANELGYATMMFQPPPIENAETYGYGEQGSLNNTLTNKEIYLPSYLKWENNLSERLAGVIHFGIRDVKRDPPLEVLWADDSLPQIVISGHVRNQPHIASIAGDVSVGATAAAEHLRDAGHQRVGVLTQHDLETDNTATFAYEAENRHLVIVKVLNSCGLDTPEQCIFGDCKSADNVREVVKAILELPDHPTALCCTNDQLARMVIDALEYFDCKVPDDISVIGYNDSEEAIAGLGITTIKQPFRTTGSRAVKMLVEMYEHGLDLEDLNIKMPTSLVIRASVAPVAAMAY